MSKYIFFDWDGTLIGRSRKLNQENIEAIKELRRNGHKVFMCSGRAPVYLQNVLRGILEVDGYVGSAGGCVFVEGQCVFENAIDTRILDEVRAAFDRNQIYYNLENNQVTLESKEGRMLMFRHLKNVLGVSDDQMGKVMEDMFQEKILDLSEYTKETPIQKCTFSTEFEDHFELVRPLLEENFFLNIFWSGNGILSGEIIPKNCTKQDGIAKVLKYYGADWKDTIGFGDSMNDAQMLDAVDIAVVWEDAEEVLKAKADLLFEDPDLGGIAGAIRRLQLV